MKTLKKRIENFNFYLNSKEYPTSHKKTIREAESRMAGGRLARALDHTRSTRTSEKIRYSV